jgi:hypothetical protein
VFLIIAVNGALVPRRVCLIISGEATIKQCAKLAELAKSYSDIAFNTLVGIGHVLP